MRELVVYTAARLGLFLVAYALVVGGYLLLSDDDQVPLLWPFLVAVLVSAIASAFLLRRQRDRLAAHVQQRAERSAARRRAVEQEERRRGEDA